MCAYVACAYCDLVGMDKETAFKASEAFGNKSVVCKDLKGLETKQVLSSCDGCIRDAAEILEGVLL